MAEPKIVVTHREHLWYLLAEAAQLEHMIMCQYLFAEFTLKQGTDEGLTEEQLAAVDRWRATLHEIAVQEMLHLALVANLMCAIGAVPPFGRPNFPQRCGYFPSGVQLELLPFGEPALKHFLYLERPEGMELMDAEGFVPCAPPRAPLEPDEVLPRGQEFATVGHLYRGIADGLRYLAAKHGEDGLFIGLPGAQATPEELHWPDLVAVTDLKSAVAAVDKIIEQGEGCCGDWRLAHYGRFLEIWEEYHTLREQDPSFDPARPALAAFVRQPYDSQDPQPLVTDPAAKTVAELFNLGYEVVLQSLLRVFTRTDETPEQVETLLGAAIGVMVSVLNPLGTLLTRMPAGPEHPGRTAGPAFEIYYMMTNAVPHRPAAWTILAERAQMLAERCSAAGMEDRVTQAATRIATNLSAGRAWR